MKKLAIWPLSNLLFKTPQSSIAFAPVSGQQATLWGPGNNYEIDYLHSGSYIVNGQTKISFDKQPSTEYTINLLTNDGYQYTYLGYNGSNSVGQVTMQTLSFGVFSIDFPTGDMPVALPLAYGQEDNWLSSFSQKLNELVKLNPDNRLFNGSSSITSDRLIMQFTLHSNTSISLSSGFFNLPQLQIPQYEGKNNTFVNSTVVANLSYQLNTGVLFHLNITITADELLVDNISQGLMLNSQQLEFVAIDGSRWWVP